MECHKSHVPNHQPVGIRREVHSTDILWGNQWIWKIAKTPCFFTPWPMLTPWEKGVKRKLEQSIIISK
jgi:hypothetical protein